VAVSGGGGVVDEVRGMAVISWVSSAAAFSSQNGGEGRLDIDG
jgi:hypothetical protein